MNDPRFQPVDRPLILVQKTPLEILSLVALLGEGSDFAVYRKAHLIDYDLPFTCT